MNPLNLLSFSSHFTSWLPGTINQCSLGTWCFSLRYTSSKIEIISFPNNSYSSLEPVLTKSPEITMKSTGFSSCTFEKIFRNLFNILLYSLFQSSPY